MTGIVNTLMKINMTPHSSLSNACRCGVGLVIMNAQGLVFVGERIDTPGSWQMPQGGLDDGESPEQALFREMKEEIGSDKGKIIAQAPQWIEYNIPSYVSSHYPVRRSLLWFQVLFLGVDTDINLNSVGHPEFLSWKWILPENLLESIVDFKKSMYIQVLSFFFKFLKDGEDIHR